MAVLIETSLGDITLDLYTKERPRSSLNFLKLCKMKYYNFCLFHSVQRNLVAQTGDPTGTGRSGQSVFVHLYGDQAVYFDMETVPRIKHRKKGLVSMVNNGSNVHGSQFFFTLAENLDYLDGVHTVIGEVAEGMDVLDKINEAYCDDEHRPYKDIRIYHTIILDDPYADPEGLVFPDRSPEPTKEQLDSGRIAADEDIDDTKGMTEMEVQESLEKKEAQANAQILEMVGDLPDADVKPPDNVLFVCKLNPVTTSEDLEIIFSRFGTILSCEVIKDQKTEESLQYAFIEFEKPEDCEAAYFKMDNVLIDDRRVHVDFSQSVSKLKFEAGAKSKGTGLFSSKYTIKDSSRKDDKYALVFEENSEKYSRDSKKSRPLSRSRSPDISCEERKKERDSRSPADKRRTDREDDGHKKRKRYDSSDDDVRKKKDKNRKHKKKGHSREKTRSNDSDHESDSHNGYSKVKSKYAESQQKGSSRRKSPDTDSDTDVRKKGIIAAGSRYSERDSDKKRYAHNKDKTKTHRRRSYSGSNDESSPDRKKKKKKSRKADSQSGDSSDERSKFSRKSVKKREQKSRDSSSDSERDYGAKKRDNKKEYGREKTRDDRYEKDRKYSKNRDNYDKKYYDDYRSERSRDDRYDERDRSEKRYRDRR